MTWLQVNGTAGPSIETWLRRHGYIDSPKAASPCLSKQEPLPPAPSAPQAAAAAAAAPLPSVARSLQPAAAPQPTQPGTAAGLQLLPATHSLPRPAQATAKPLQPTQPAVPRAQPGEADVVPKRSAAAMPPPRPSPAAAPQRSAVAEARSAVALARAAAILKPPILKPQRDVRKPKRFAESAPPVLSPSDRLTARQIPHQMYTRVNLVDDEYLTGLMITQVASDVRQGMLDVVWGSQHYLL